MSMFSSSRRSCRASYMLLIVSQNASVNSQSFRTSTLYLVLVLLFISLFFYFILASNIWWSEVVSASLCTLCMSCIDLLNFCPIQMWSIWFSVLWTGDIQVALCILLCGNKLPPIINLLNAQRSANVSPFSFIVPSPCLPNDFFISCVICSYFRIEVSHEYCHVLRLHFVKHCLQSAVKYLLCFFILFICWYVALYDV